MLFPAKYSFLKSGKLVFVNHISNALGTLRKVDLDSTHDEMDSFIHTFPDMFGYKLHNYDLSLKDIPTDPSTLNYKKQIQYISIAP